MPPSHPLELCHRHWFHGYRRDIAIADPKLIGERAHRHVLSFRLGDGADQFDEAHNGALTLRHGTTMSFPGAFPPTSLASFQAAVAKDAATSRECCRSSGVSSLSPCGPSCDVLHRRRHARRQPFGHASTRSENGRPTPRSGAGCSTSSRIPRRGGAAGEETRQARSRRCSRRSRAARERAGAQRHHRGRQRTTLASCSPGDRRDVVRADSRADRGDRGYPARPAHTRQSTTDVVQWRTRPTRMRSRPRLRLRERTWQQGQLRDRELRPDDAVSPTSGLFGPSPGVSSARSSGAAADTHLRHNADGGKLPSTISSRSSARSTSTTATAASIRDRRSQRLVRARRRAGYPTRAQLDEAKRELWDAGSSSQPCWARGGCRRISPGTSCGLRFRLRSTRGSLRVASRGLCDPARRRARTAEDAFGKALEQR